MRASIAIASHKEGDLLWKTVQSCLETTEELDIEIVVADDASRDGSVEELNRRFPEVETLVSETRLGVSATKDRAGRRSSGDVIIFLDAHCKPEPGAIERLIRDVIDFEGDAVFTPKVASLDVASWENHLNHVGYGYKLDLVRFDTSWVDRDRLEVISGPGGRSYLRQPSVIGCCVALTRSLYEELCGFDPHMLSYGSEDVDFGLKSWLMGHPVYVDPEVTVGHRFRKSFENYEVPKSHSLLNQFRMARKNFTDPVWEDWLRRNKRHHAVPVWQTALGLFEQTRETVERERDYLMTHRKHDEFWYAKQFDLVVVVDEETSDLEIELPAMTVFTPPPRSPEPRSPHPPGPAPLGPDPIEPPPDTEKKGEWKVQTEPSKEFAPTPTVFVPTRSPEPNPPRS